MGSAYSEVAGYNIITVAGTITDVDNDDVIVTAKLKDALGTVVATKDTTVEKCGQAQPFSIEFAVSGITEGKYSIEVIADDGK